MYGVRSPAGKKVAIVEWWAPAGTGKERLLPEADKSSFPNPGAFVTTGAQKEALPIIKAIPSPTHTNDHPTAPDGSQQQPQSPPTHID